ncbi:hypothetical protein DM02DRAFT_533140, partial [Periconia macrospinosa]
MNTSTPFVPEHPSRKQLRTLKKTQRRRSESAKDQITLGTQETPEIVLQADEFELYECGVCLEEVSPAKVTITCDAHVVCNDCVPLFFKHALANLGEFPARCCPQHALQPKMYSHLLSPQLFEKYLRRAREHFTKLSQRNYCANLDCGSFIPKANIVSLEGAETAKCDDCDTLTCTGCKGIWKNKWHICDKPADGPPNWLPEYTKDCRIKRCPRCHIFVEHREACNHMTCSFCKAEFCFICFRKWKHFHHDCPEYGDPEYDEDGFEVGKRGLHRLTGLTRSGYDVY